ncbi:MAG: CRISPR-associated helicase Cas3' [Oscillospiraceae bacterium]|nr:CRISPR-associated helicase Cas3' [Oscillospiraceae bacterium]
MKREAEDEKPRCTEFPAHIKYTGTEKTVQTVQAHCRKTAEYAAGAAPETLRQTAYLCGLLHDAGKYTQRFKDYIERAARGELVRRGSVNHTFAAVRLVMERWHGDAQSFESLTAELTAFAAGAHHGQFDCISPQGEDGFARRLTAGDIDFDEAKEGYLALCADETELDGLFSAAVGEIAALSLRIGQFSGGDEAQLFYLSLAARLLLSAVIEGDRRDTAEFMSGSTPAEPGRPFADCLKTVTDRLDGLPQKRPIDRTRRQISDICLTAAKRPAGIYTLSVPTGGGKTLTALRYALSFAAEHHMRRILFAVPILSVLEQNAKAIRAYVGNDDLILEHHSNLVREKVDGEADVNELLTERWSSPIIITTLVQLLNTLFDGSPACIRRMQALYQSVIVIDEVQSVPSKLISQFNMALNFLTKICGADVVLCSATQPCFAKTAHPLLLSRPPVLVPRDEALWRVFRRTDIIDRRRSGGYDAQELAELAGACAEQYGSVLVICNKRAQARTVFSLLGGGERDKFHLSTSMCMAHRIKTLERINASLDDKARRTICVSTQLVEAGMDFSFGCVIRLLAGLDNIVQAAGRCNRSGESDEPLPVFIVNARDEDLSRLQDILAAQNACKGLLEAYGRDPARFEGSLAGDRAVETYYSGLFAAQPKGTQDYPLKELGTDMLELLGANNCGRRKCAGPSGYLMAQAFRTAGDEFQVFDDKKTDVVASYGEGRQIVEELCGERAKHDFAYRKALLEKAKPFSVSLYRYEITDQNCRLLFDRAVTVLQQGYYSEETGFCVDGGKTQFAEVRDDI